MPDKKEERSAGLYDYLNWRGDISFELLPPCEVDNLIFSIIAYVDFSDIVPEELNYAKKPSVLLNATKSFLRARSGILRDLGLMIPRETVTLLVRAAKTARFGLCRPFCFVNRVCDEEQKQFSAISFMLPGGDTFVTFRGTDDTIIGWKENFNMTFMHPVPAQTEALLYLENIARITTGKLYVGGHSKGGNLAVYASVKACERTRERIVAVYNNDGPGFDREFIESEDYLAMSQRIHTLVPQSSVVGMLLEHEERYTVVKSTSSGIMQHNGLTWSVMGGKFIHLDSIDDSSKLLDTSLKDWLAGLSPAEREDFVEKLYEAAISTNAKTLSELNSDKRKLLKVWSAIDNDARSQLIKCINIVLGRKNKEKSPKTATPEPNESTETTETNTTATTEE